MPRRAATAALLRFGAALAWLGLGASAASAQEFRADVSARARYDDDAEGTDWDALGYANISLTDLIKNRLDLKLSGWGLWDIDGNDDYDDAIDGKRVRISEAYADIRNMGPVSRLRLGRQRIYDVDYLRFDGATVRFREGKPLSFFVFGGREYTYYRSAEGNWVGGGGIAWRPTWKMKQQLDFYALDEQSETLVASAWRWNQSWGLGWRTTSRLRFIDTEIRDWRFHVSKFFQGIGVGFDVDYYIQPRTRGRGDEVRTRSLSSLGSILGRRVPNHRLAIDLQKTFGENWMIQTGGTVRRRLENNGEDSFNSVDSESFQISGTRFNAFLKGLDATVGYQWINNEYDSLNGMTGQLSYRPNKQWEFSAGASYSRFRFRGVDFNYDELRAYDHGDADEDPINDLKIPVYFVEARWRPNKTFDVRAEVSYEDTDDYRGTGWSARLGVNYHIRQSFAPKEDP